jgi:hypothetical protein
MLRYGEEVIFLGQSDEFGRIVSMIIGRRGLREAEELTGISAAYLGAMKAGKVPSEEIIARFVVGFNVQGELATRLYEAAKAVKGDLDPELIMQFACDAAGMDTMQRMAVIDEFRRRREESERQAQNSNAA